MNGVYFNEFDKFAASWLRNLFPESVVDERSIKDVGRADTAVYKRCHFFGGIGGWEYALQLAGWPEDRPVWTGSCPCQPFSAAGKQKGQDDDRHLWPEMFRLIRECRPATIFGEQVASKLGREWLSGVRTDLEALGYAFGAADLCAAGVGSPHIRQRLFWVAQSSSSRSQERDIRKPSIPESCEDIANGWVRVVFSSECDEYGNCPFCGIDYSECGCPGPTQDEEYEYCERGGVMLARRLGQSFQSRLEGHSGNGNGSHESRWLASQEGRSASEAGPANFWSDFRIIHCTDGKARRTGRSVFPLVNGIPREMGRGQPELGKLVKCARSNRVGRLKGYGNAIVPQVAAEFIRAFLESEAEVMS